MQETIPCMEVNMAKLNPSTAPKIGIQIYVTKEMHTQIVAECSNCACRMAPFVRTAIAKELLARRAARAAESKPDVLAGQVEMAITDGN
jgi:hypothetical protein